MVDVRLIKEINATCLACDLRGEGPEHGIVGH